MRSFEQNQNDQDLRIMAASVFSANNEVFSVFGLSSGEIEFHRINLKKKRLEMLKECTIRVKGSVLCMKKQKFPSATLLVVGLSSGDIYLISAIDGLETKIIGTLKNVHDFGVNSLDAVTFIKSHELVKS